MALHSLSSPLAHLDGEIPKFTGFMLEEASSLYWEGDIGDTWGTSFPVPPSPCPSNAHHKNLWAFLLPRSPEALLQSQDFLWE